MLALNRRAKTEAAQPADVARERSSCFTVLWG